MSTNLENPLQKIIPGSILDRRRSWYVFRAFNLYRLTLVALLFGVFVLDQESRFFGTRDPELFGWTIMVYLILVLAAIGLGLWRRPSLSIQSHLQAFIDIVALSLLMYASGGAATNLGIVLVMALAASGVLLPLHSLLLLATLAFFLTLGGWVYQAWTPYADAAGVERLTLEHIGRFSASLLSQNAELGRIGILGASFFVASLITFTLAERARRGEDLARQRSHELLEMAELNRAIIKHLQSGIIVVDSMVRIRLMNDTASELLNYHESAAHLPLNEISPQLSQRLATWLSSGLHNPKPFRQHEHLPDVTPYFSHLKNDILIFLEDSSQTAQRLHQIKLAALGRLTAGIAHEIRNPLSSISHAAQLLNESKTASTGDRRLSQIVHDNAKRANKIITNVLDLSRRDKVRPEDLVLKSWLEEFCREFLLSRNDTPPKIELRVKPADIAIRFDPSHLQQVLWNLCNNACLHGASDDGTVRIRLSAQIDERRGRPYLDVIDFGSGIPEIEIKKIFEPFFTTQPKGTGLGSYISREMCEANRAQLQYLRLDEESGSCFRLTFASASRADKESKWTVTAL